MAWIKVGSAEELAERSVITVRGKDRRIAVFWNSGDPRAVDNRCPHMGFPLDQGSVRDGVLTCHWHHARFALQGGCAFDLFADDVPTFGVRREGDEVSVSDEPEMIPTQAYYRARLRRGLEQNLNLIQAKSIVGLRKAGVSTADILRELVEFGTENHDGWRDGMTLVALMARLDPVLEERTRLHGLSMAANRLAQNCANRPRRRERGALHGADEPFDRVQGWFRQFVMMRQRDGAERAMLTAESICSGDADRQRLLAGAILQRIYLDSGHLYDFANKVLELGRYLDADAHGLWPRLLPLLVAEAVEGQGEEDRGSWRSPLDLIPAVRAAEEAVAGLAAGQGEVGQDLRGVLLGDDPHGILDRLVADLQAGADPFRLALEIAMAAAWRLGHFSPANELGDWFDPLHTFTYANAVVQSTKRAPAPEVLPALLHGAMAVYQDRFLNVPPAAYPATSPTESIPEALLDELLSAMDHAPNPRLVVEATVRWVRGGGSIARLTDCLAWAAIREDLDFHKLQAVEGAYQLSQEVTTVEDRALLFAAAARHLAVHCPTPRTRQQSTLTALKLHRSE